MPFPMGVPAPYFHAPSFENPNFAFGSLGGRFVLLAFLPQHGAARARAMQVLGLLEPSFRPERLVAFAVSREPLNQARRREAGRLRWFFDPDGEISRLYDALDGSGAERPHWVLIDPSLRLLATGGFEEADRLAWLLLQLPVPNEHAGVPLNAPVLIVPRIFEPELCPRLIAHYEAAGGEPSGVMQEIGGRTVGVLNDFKRRRDAQIEEEGFRADLRARIVRRLLPEIKKAFQYEVTRMERYIVACYDADEGGYFRPHRDDTTRGTAHRRFACSINLNAEDHEGGDLRFPEFGWRSYRPPTGGAVVFSCSLLHEATPVTKGRRYAFLPFFYDEEGARVREANAKYMGPAEPAVPPAARAEQPEPAG